MPSWAREALDFVVMAAAFSIGLGIEVGAHRGAGSAALAAPESQRESGPHPPPSQKMDPRQRSLTPADITQSISQPYKESSVPAWSLVLIDVLLPLAVIGALSPRLLGKRLGATDAWVSGKCLLTALAVTELFTGTLKTLVARPRPNFKYSCWPDGAMTWEDEAAGVVRCTNPSAHAVDEARRSFPSGHSSLSAAGLGFLTLYLYGKLGCFRRGPSETRLGAWVVATVPAFAACVIGASRVADNKHHPFDVLAGLAIGFAMAAGAFLQHYSLSGPGAGRGGDPGARAGGAGWVGVPDWAEAEPGPAETYQQAPGDVEQGAS